LRLEVEMVREDFGESAVGAPPNYTTSNIKTTVTVPDGSTIILGGLTKLNQLKGGNKVPLLGDIPIAGALFRSVDTSDDERKLYVFVKANILRPDQTAGGLAQLREISQRNKAAFESSEAAFQSYRTFPGLKPKVMEPLHVLETD
jgi:general secretion pathway protein D